MYGMSQMTEYTTCSHVSPFPCNPKSPRIQLVRKWAPISQMAAPYINP